MKSKCDACCDTRWNGLDMKSSKPVMAMSTAPVDLIISDVLLTGQGGFETITALRHEAPGIKIIAMSGGGYLGDSDLLDIARQLGAQRTLQKPFELGDLFATVWEVLQGSDA
jgi:DNA-binding response OmpR family regulator